MSDVEISRLRDRIRELEAQVERTLELERTLRHRERELNDSLQHATKGMLAVGQFARAEAERANRLRDEFLAVLSHELRTPLNAILGWTQIVNGRNVDEAVIRRAFTVIERNAALQLRHIDDLLDVSRIATGKLQIATEPVDLTAVVSSAIERVTPAATEKNIVLNVQLDAEGACVTGDVARLQQMAWHLVTNAVKFTPKSGEVHVSLLRAGDDVELCVRDSGEGISAEFLPHVFAPFRQADGSTTRSHRGIGLGLAVVRHLTEAHGGRIAVHSDGPGCGTTFTVTLPLQADVARPEPVSRALAAPIDLSGARILVVDDNADARDVLVYAARDTGAAVDGAASANDALDLVARRAYDAVIADLSMPDVDGYALIEALQHVAGVDGRHPLAIAVTAYAGDSHRRRALGAGYDAYLPKPIAPADLAHTLQTLLTARIDASIDSAAV